MRVAIIADTHMPRGSRRLPERCVTEIASADLLLHLGDFHAVETRDRLAELGPPLKAVHGNVDQAGLRASLPEHLELLLGGVRVALVHEAGPARGRIKRLRRRFPAAELVLFGHSHVPADESSADLRIFNPGSPTERRRAPHRTMGIAELDRGAVELRHVILD